MWRSSPSARTFVNPFHAFVSQRFLRFGAMAAVFLISVLVLPELPCGAQEVRLHGHPRPSLASRAGDRPAIWHPPLHTSWQDEMFYSEAVSQIDHIKTAWRNPTMHVDRVYTEEVAHDIFLAIKSMMRHLAARLHE